MLLQCPVDFAPGWLLQGLRYDIQWTTLTQYDTSLFKLKDLSNTIRPFMARFLWQNCCWNNMGESNDCWLTINQGYCLKVLIDMHSRLWMPLMHMIWFYYNFKFVLHKYCTFSFSKSNAKVFSLVAMLMIPWKYKWASLLIVSFTAVIRVVMQCFYPLSFSPSGEKRCVTTLITAGKETSLLINIDV